MNNVCAVCLMGGEARRFNYLNKGLLPFNNNDNFIEQIQNQFQDYDFYFSTHFHLDNLQFPQIIDQYPERIGPIGAISSCFNTLKTEYIFITSCDMPFITSELIDYFYAQTLKYPHKTLIAKVDNKLYPTFGIYARSASTAINAAISTQNYRLVDLIKNIDHQIIDLTTTIFNQQLLNINDQNTYNKYFKQPNIVCICGFKNSGKTTLISKLLPFFIKDNLKVAVLKHDAHQFQFDYENTDTMQFVEAGAKHITIFNQQQLAQVINEQFSLTNYLNQLSNYDFILIEGLKDSDYPKIHLDTTIETKSLTNVLFNVNKNGTNLSNNEINWNDYQLIYQTIRKEFNER